MLVKRIVCTVEAHQRGSLHMAQMEWAALRTVEGFIAQLGGWDTSDASIAYIYSFWENRDRYEISWRTYMTRSSAIQTRVLLIPQSRSSCSRGRQVEPPSMSD
ncbi:DUF4937 domain-containing protein [Rossellomorea marisflavi]|uniref:DUF4937 domain-containing protein n=1 Tax=Rossellomorea marisflavi TaxID=189381 RepID=UPI003458B509